MFHKTLNLIFKGCIIQTEVWNTMIIKDRDEKKVFNKIKNPKIDRGAGNFRFHSLPFINTSKTHAFDCVLKFWKMVVGGWKILESYRYMKSWGKESYNKISEEFSTRGVPVLNGSSKVATEMTQNIRCACDWRRIHHVGGSGTPPPPRAQRDAA